MRVAGSLGYLRQDLTLDAALPVDEVLGIAGARRALAAIERGEVSEGHFRAVGDDWDVEERAGATLDRLGLDHLEVDLPATSVPAGRTVLTVREARLRGGALVDLELRGPERAALLGANGAGKTTLLETVVGTLDPLAGTVAAAVPLRYLPQRLDVLDDQATVAANLLDEPTNNLDLASTRQLAQALAAYRGALLVASHDLAFLHTIGVTRWLRLDGRLRQVDPP